MFYQAVFDPAVGEAALYEPELRATVDAGSLKVLAHERWRKPVLVHASRPLCHEFTPAVRALPPEQRAAFGGELLQLCEQVRPLAGRADLSSAERRLVHRFDELFRFLIDPKFFRYYQRLSPPFFEWLTVQRGGGLTALTASPSPEPVLEVPPPVIPYEPDGGPWDQLLPSAGPPPVRLADADLGGALARLGLTPSETSPLAGAPAAQGPATASTEVDDWLTPDLQVVLRTLCDPGWEIVHACGNDSAAALGRYYAGRDRRAAVWVRHERDDGGHLMFFPDDPARLERQTRSTLAAETIRVADPTNHHLSTPELGAVFALADLNAAGADWTERAAPDALASWLAQEPGPGSLRWYELASALSPVPLPDPREILEAGIGKLASRRLLVDQGGRLVPDPRLRYFVRSLEAPLAYTSLLVVRIVDDRAEATGLAAVRTDRQLWAWEPAEREDVRLFQLTGRQLDRALEALLGTRPEGEA
jgi:hypothetical protein